MRNLGFKRVYCMDGAARKANLHKPIGLWPCHGQAGNQVIPPTIILHSSLALSINSERSAQPATNDLYATK